MADLLESLAGMSDGVMAVDGAQRIVLWNRAAEALLGVTAQDALGRHCYQVLRCRDERGVLMCERGCRTMTLATQGVRPPTGDMLIQTTRGQPVWLNVSRLLISRARPDGAAFVYIFRDVSHQKALEQVLHQLSDSLVRLAARSRPDQQSPDLEVPLTLREREVLKLLAVGASTAGMAERLAISPATVKNHIKHILVKLGAHNRLEAITLANRGRLL